jgi:hypothetical protein
VAALCRSAYEPPFAPNVKRAAPRGFASPVCAVHGAVRAFTDSLLAGDPLATVIAPAGTCAARYGGP